MRRLELLSPARDCAIAREAILHGADAVYIGGPGHGARAAACNSIADIASLTEYAHLYGVRVYITLNTIIHEHELAEVERQVRDLYRAGADALIVQDMGLLRMDLPPIDLHASTQCDIRTPQKAAFLARCGFSQLVLPRELSLDQIREMRQAVGPEVALEAFVHGALCVSYSGDCQASAATCGRSGNRGECAQVCRQSYDLTDSRGRVLVRDRHLLSLRDLCRLDDLEALADAGVTSFKIEGRLKDAVYVKNVTAAYSRALDSVVETGEGRYSRASRGKVALGFEPDIHKTFNRGYTRYFLDGRPGPQTSMANTATPKWVGEKAARVEGADGRTIIVKGRPDLANGDGLGYYDRAGRFRGFRLNRIEGNRLYPATAVDIDPGTLLYRNNDSRWAARLARPTAERRMGVDMRLWRGGGSLWLRMGTDGDYIIVGEPCEAQAARTPQREARAANLGRLGGTPYMLEGLDDRLDDLAFVPASTLAALRRKAVEALTGSLQATYPYRYRRGEDRGARYVKDSLDYHDNVSNSLAEDFYLSHGARTAQRALECGGDPAGRRVMTTRYCLRRELGACLRGADGSRLPSELWLRSGDKRFRLEFDCKECRMEVYNAGETPTEAPEDTQNRGKGASRPKYRKNRS